jgi:hypothetical protein
MGLQKITTAQRHGLFMLVTARARIFFHTKLSCDTGKIALYLSLLHTDNKTHDPTQESSDAQIKEEY